MKKVLSFVLVLVMMMTMSLSALAVTVVFDDPQGLLAGHKIEAYQVFAGDYHKEGENETLSNITWGNGIDAGKLVTALKADATVGAIFAGLDFSKTSCASDLAAILVTATNAQVEKFIDIAQNCLSAEHKIDVVNGMTLTDGYYLVIDETVVDGQDMVNNASLLQVVGDTLTVAAKVEKPTLVKKVFENDYPNTDTVVGAGQLETGYNDVATYSIGDTVPFKLYSTVPNMDQFAEYEMAFDDTLSPGLELNVESITVTIAGKELVKGTVSGDVHTGDYHVSVTKYDQTNHGDDPIGATYFRVHLPDLKSIQIDDGKGGKRPLAKNDAIIVSYTATLDKDAIIGGDGNPNVARLTYSNNPDTDEMGITPPDQVIVFTMGLEITKVDGANEAHKLKGVEFVLWNASKTHFAVVDADAKFSGWVEKTASVTPQSYSSIEFKALLETDIDGNVSIKGLDDGTYYAEETKALAGYNKLVEPVKIVIDSATKNGQSWDGTPSSALTGFESGSDKDTDSDWLVEKQIKNFGGTVLPETGGMGTVLFIAVGCVLILGASVVMVTRKKMSVYAD